MGQGWPTCDHRIRSWLERVVEALGEELGSAHVGTYLHGSLAQGSYHPPKSDIDLIVVSEAALSPSERRSAALLCADLSDERPTIGGLELSVVTSEVVARPPHPAPYEVHFGEELTEAIRAGGVDWASTRYDTDLAAHFQSILESGLVLRGRPIAETFGPVPSTAFWDAVLSDLAWILTDDNILESPYYGVLNACRVLMVKSDSYAGLVPSKAVAGAWATEALPATHRPLVRVALAAYQSAEPVALESRRTSGVEWDEDALLAFRDYVRRATQHEFRQNST